jgi:hypothetical protein
VASVQASVAELGYVEGGTFVLKLRYGETRFERLSALARVLVGLKVGVHELGHDR